MDEFGVCSHCSLPFKRERSDAKTCSAKCRQARSRIRRRIRAEAAAMYIECGQCGIARLHTASGPCAVCGAIEELSRMKGEAA